MDAVDLVFGYLERLEKIFLGEQEIAIRMLRGNASFVRPEKMNPRKIRRLCPLGDRGEELLRNAPAGEPDQIQSRGGGWKLIQPFLGGMLGQPRVAGAGDELPIFH